MNRWFQEFISDVEANTISKTSEVQANDPEVISNLRKTVPKSPLLVTDKTDKSSTAELESSLRRLQSQNGSIAVFDDGTIWIVERDKKQDAINRGGTLYSPEDILMYVTLNERERRMI